jgi:hypothetical protein
MRPPIPTLAPLVVGLLLAVGGTAVAQSAPQTKFWPRHDISFPLDRAVLDTLDPKPVSVRFYAAPPDGRFKLIANKRPNELDKIVDKQDPSATPRYGFTYVAAGDGVEEFAVQYEFADGRLAPAKPAPQYRVHFDKTPPEIRASATGGTGIRWTATDENLVESSVRIEGQYVGETQWQALNTGELRADDSFRWPTIPAGKTLEVRVFARDKAGNGGYSKVIRLGAGGGRADRDRDRADNDFRKPAGDPLTRPDGGNRVGTGFGGLDEFPTNRAKIEYRDTNKLTVKSKVTHITRSGVKAAQLFVQSGTADWVPAGKQEGLSFTLDTADPTVSIPFDAPKDGLYGFIIQPVSGAGTKADDPRQGDAPQYLVEVDTTPPEMLLKGVRVGGGGLTGPLVDIEWVSSDKNEMPEPISLEYSEDDKKTWKRIVERTANTGKYTWEITDKKLWRFHVRASAVDKAGNSKFDVTKEPVLVDLDKPSGTVEQVNPNGQPTTPRKQVNHTPDDRSNVAGTPATLNVLPAKNDAPPAALGGRIALPPPNKDEPKKEEKKPDAGIPPALPPISESKPPVPPVKADPVVPPPTTLPPIPPAGGGESVPTPALPPLPGK